ncbi:QueC-like queuosine biosynthesis [Vibrio phage D480]|nr:7-cyano-7-deazaguanine synthase [Vibrio phage 6E35.1a]
MKEVILISGLDSIVLYEMLKSASPNLIPVYFKWGFDIDDAEIKMLPSGTKIHEVPEWMQFDTDGKLGGDECINLDGRDTIMMNLVMHIYKPYVIYKGTIANDTSYVESHVEFTEKISRTWRLINRHECDIKHPFIKKTKRDIIAYANKLGIDARDYQYCYNAVGNCGVCNKCRMTRLLSMYSDNPDVEFLRSYLGECQKSATKKIGDYLVSGDVVEELTTFLRKYNEN